MEPKPLQGAVRVAALVALVLATGTGACSAGQAMTLAGSERLDSANAPSNPLFGDPEFARKVTKAQADALEPLRGSGSLLLGGLAIACGLASVAAGRLFRPRGLSREPLRRLLGGSLLLAALLRTLNGAMEAAVANRVGQAVAPSLPVPPELIEAVPRLLVSFAALHTVAVGGTFLFLGQYFRSRRIQELLMGLETKMPHRGA